MQDRYFRFERAGDQFCGRVLCELPLENEAFASLPPHFCMIITAAKERTVRESVKACFPRLSDLPKLCPVLHHCLASVVYHRDYLTRTLPATHPLFNTPLFTSHCRGSLMIEALKDCVHAGYECENVSATGLPGHTSVLRRFEQLEQAIKRMEMNVTQSVASVVGNVERVLELHGTIVVISSTILHLSLQIPFLAGFSIRILFASLLVLQQLFVVMQLGM